MPPQTSVRTFIRALQEGRTRVTKALDKLFENPEDLQDNDFWVEFRDTPNVLNGALPGPVQELLEGQGLQPEEIEHAGHWPDTRKEELRQILASAIADGRRVQFEWELWRGANSVNAIDVPDEGDISITFRSPRSGLGLVATSVTENYDLNVDIEPSGEPLA